jgi:hypothetical protein
MHSFPVVVTWKLRGNYSGVANVGTYPSLSLTLLWFQSNRSAIWELNVAVVKGRRGNVSKTLVYIFVSLGVTHEVSSCSIEPRPNDDLFSFG